MLWTGGFRSLCYKQLFVYFQTPTVPGYLPSRNLRQTLVAFKHILAIRKASLMKWFLHPFGWDMLFVPYLFVWEGLLDLWLANWLILDSLSQSGYSVKTFQRIYHTVSRWQLGGSLICWAVKLPAYAAGEALMYRNITWEGWNVGNQWLSQYDIA